MVGPLGGGKLADHSLDSWFNYATPYWAVTILLGGVLLAIVARFPETHRATEDAGRYLDAFTNLARIVTDRRLRPLYLINFVLYLAIFGFFRVYPMYLVDQFHLGVGSVSEFIAYVAVPIVIANVWLVGALSRRASPRTMVLFSAFGDGRVDGADRRPQVEGLAVVHTGSDGDGPLARLRRGRFATQPAPAAGSEVSR